MYGNKQSYHIVNTYFQTFASIIYDEGFSVTLKALSHYALFHSRSFFLAFSLAFWIATREKRIKRENDFFPYITLHSCVWSLRFGTFEATKPQTYA